MSQLTVNVCVGSILSSEPRTVHRTKVDTHVAISLQELALHLRGPLLVIPCARWPPLPREQRIPYRTSSITVLTIAITITI
eukprot:5481775-Amphidinium_carterae.1